MIPTAKAMHIALAIAAMALPAAAPATAQGAPGTPSDPALLERGRYLIEVVAFCGACHTTRDPRGALVAGMEQAGGRTFEERGFRAVAPNITPDLETGIGRWTDAQIADAIRNGRRPDGSLIGPPMPVESYRGIADGDLAAMVAYLRSVPPVRHAVTERSRYPFALVSHGAPVTSVAAPPADDPVRRGEYVAVALAHCMDCHSGQVSEGRRDPARAGATGLVLEGPWGVVVARNISSHAELGVGRWTDDQIIGAITRGVSADGRRLAPPMGGRAPVWARIAPADLRDLVSYIRALAPQDP